MKRSITKRSEVIIAEENEVSIKKRADIGWPQRQLNLCFYFFDSKSDDIAVLVKIVPPTQYKKLSFLWH